MGINIGNQNVFQGNIVIGNHAIQVAKKFNQEFDSTDKLLSLIKNDLMEYYSQDDKENVIKEYDQLHEELLKPLQEQNKELIRSKINYLSNSFQFISNCSSIAGLILTITSAMA